jgi:hypothetical protein
MEGDYIVVCQIRTFGVLTSRRSHYQICGTSTLERPNVGEFYQLLRPKIDLNLPDSDKTEAKIQRPQLQTNTGGVGITEQAAFPFDP